LYLHAYYDIGVKPKRMSVFCTAYIVKMAVTAFLVIYLLMLAVSRVYVGAHSWNQVLFGATIGSVLALISHRYLKP
jgi:membrane-associated phospholipid phosphatase